MPDDPTQLLRAMEPDDSRGRGTAEEMLPLVYQELRRLAACKMAQEKAGQTLQATALVHEAWLRVAGSDRQQWRGRSHFFSAAAEAMRRILVENARRRQRIRHGGGLERVPVESIDLPVAQNDAQCLLVSECLQELAQHDPEKAEIVKLRIFTGLGMAEIADILGYSERTVLRQWNYARAWLNRCMLRSESPGAFETPP